MFSIPPAVLIGCIVALAGVIIGLTLWILRLEGRLKRLLRGKQAESLEDTILYLTKKLDGFERYNAEINKALTELDARIKKSVSGVHTVRFNPFKDQGGNQSFATALLNEEGDGVILSSLYGRDKVGIYAKPVKNNVSEHELSKEESAALAGARKG